jgi:hypothetical protein
MVIWVMKLTGIINRERKVVLLTETNIHTNTLRPSQHENPRLACWGRPWRLAGGVHIPPNYYEMPSRPEFHDAAGCVGTKNSESCFLKTVSPACLKTASPACLKTVSPACLKTVSPACLKTVSPACLKTVSPACFQNILDFYSDLE